MPNELSADSAGDMALTDGPVTEIEATNDKFAAIISATKDAVILIVPGFENSGDEHWQTLWQEKFPNAVRVEQDSWFKANKDAWVSKLNDYIKQCGDKKILLVAHSLACATIKHWADEYFATTRAKIIGALLVVPADVDIPVGGIEGFAPMPLGPIPFNTMVVASEDDQIVSIQRAELFARSWRAQFRSVGKKGHINAASGIGNWPEGIGLLKELLEMGE